MLVPRARKVMAVTEFLRYRTQPKWFARSVIMATNTPVPKREPKNMGHPPRISGSKAVLRRGKGFEYSLAIIIMVHEDKV